MSLKDVSTSDEASFLHPRDPSILHPYQRPRLASPVKKQLFSGLLEEEANADASNSIKTYLRLKPTRSGDASQQVPPFSVLDDNTVVTNPPRESYTYKNHPQGRAVHQYSFTKVFRPEVQQRDLFEECVGTPMRDFIRGADCLLFAYGTTNAGKTFTIQGTGEHPGIIPRALDMLFKSIHGRISRVGRFKPEKVDSVVQLDSSAVDLELEYKQRILQWNWDKPLEPLKCSSVLSNSLESDFISSTYREMQKTLDDTRVEIDEAGDYVYGVWISFAEVYNECVYDLLEPMSRGRKPKSLKLAQEDGGVFAKDLRLIHVSSGDEAFHVMLYGKANLQIASTNMNSHSSRSHCIFTIRLVRYFNSDNPTHAHVSSYTFCDLAGAERVKKTLNVGDRLKESNNINTSLHVLGRCIMTIRENQKRKERRQIPFRDSKLTRLFQRALTGQAQISMIVNVSPSPVLYDETVNVLKFSAVAQQIVFEPQIKRFNSRHKKKSRFSMMVLQPKTSGSICWDSVTDAESNNIQSSQTTTHTSYNNIEELLILTDKLKQQLAEEREKNATLEREIRQELADNFSKMMKDMDVTYKNRMQDMEERSQKVNTWRLNQLEAYYKEKLEEGSRKRRRESEFEDNQSNVTQIKELEEEVHHLTSKNSALQQLLSDIKEEQASLLTENTALKFNLSLVQKELDDCQSALQASQQEVLGENGLLLAELQKQLTEVKKKYDEEQGKNNIMRVTLDEAKEDFLLLSSEKEEAETELSKLQQLLITKDYDIAELKNNLETAQLVFQAKSQAFEDLEEKLESLSKETQCTSKDMEKIHQRLHMLTVTDQSAEVDVQNDGSSISTLSDMQSLIKVIEEKLQCGVNLKSEHQVLLQQLAALTAEVKQKETESLLLSQQLGTAKDNREQFEDQMKLAMQKEIQDMNVQICDLKIKFESEERELVASHEKIVSQLKSELLESEALFSNLRHANDRLEGEIKLLQKEVKNLLQENRALKSDGEAKITCLEQEYKSALQKSISQSELSQASQSELETLRIKVKTYEDSMKAVQALKEQQDKSNEEVYRLRNENDQLRDQLKNKESEMESFVNNRTHLMNRYEDRLKKANDALELQKREVVQLQKALYKSTPSSNRKDQCEACQQNDLDSVSKLEKISVSEKKSSVKKQLRTAKKELDFSSESQKENIDDQSVSAVSSKAVDTDASIGSARSKTLKKQGTSVHPKTEEKAQRRGRRLYSKTDSDSLEFQDIEMEESSSKTCPERFMKTLRSRKV